MVPCRPDGSRLTAKNITVHCPEMTSGHVIPEFVSSKIKSMFLALTEHLAMAGLFMEAVSILPIPKGKSHVAGKRSAGKRISLMTTVPCIPAGCVTMENTIT